MPGKSRWTGEDIPDQTGRTVIVTGANSGIGFETACALVKKGANVFIASRNLTKCEAAAEDIQSRSPSCEIDIIHLDLSDLNSIRCFVRTFKQMIDRLDILINNAGVMAIPYCQTTDGFEMHLGVNHLGHFALTGLLIDLLMDTENSRIVTISSYAHIFARINFNNINGERNYYRWWAYCQSKLANLFFAYELQRKLSIKRSSTLSVAAHPGWTATNLQANSWFYSMLNPIMGQSPEMGALPVLYAATSPDVYGCDYIGPDGFLGQSGYPVKVRSSGHSYNEATAKKLWHVSEEMTGISYVALS